MAREVAPAPRAPRAGGHLPAGKPRANAAVGLALVLALVAWGLLAVPSAPGRGAFATVVMASAFGWLAGSLATRVQPRLSAVVVAGAVCGSVLLTLPASLSGSASAPPLHYANANAALVSASVAGLAIGARRACGRSRTVMGAAALGFTALSAVIHSVAGFVTCLLLILVSLLPEPRLAWPTKAATAMAIASAFGVTVWMGANYEGTVSAWVEESFSHERVALWSDALTMGLDHPVSGVGAGNFADFSAAASWDPDLSHAHSAPLQVFAELGFVGLALLTAITTWMIWRLGGTSGTLAVLSLQPMIDYVLHFLPVTVAFAFILGASTRTTAATPPVTSGASSGQGRHWTARSAPPGHSVASG